MKNIKYLWLFVIILGLTACNDEEDFQELLNLPEEVELPALTTGSADFSNYVALGASFTAGFSDGGLFMASQEDSFPNTLAKAFANAGGSATFTQPLMNDNYGGLAVGGNRILGPRLVFGGAGPVPLEDVVGPVTVSTDLLVNNPTGPFNNMGVPGAKSFHFLANGYGNLGNLALGLANPYFVRMTGQTPDASMMDLAVAQNPTFFTLSEVGGNDVLGYATTGGDGSDPITPTPLFDSALNGMVNMLTAGQTNNVKGVIGNVPDITSLSHFTTIPYNIIPLDAATAGAVNGAYAAYNGGLQAAMAGGLIDSDEVAYRTIEFIESATNAVVIEDEYLTDLSGLGLPNYRQATANDLFVLPALGFIGTEAVLGNPLTVNGVAIPLADKWVLTPEEQQEIADATAAYNISIKAITDANPNLALVDLNSILLEASTTGVPFDDYTMNTDLVFGGLVSLDGVHLTARGYALMANEFLKVIDTEFGSNFEASGNFAKAGDFEVTYPATLQ